jgi:hypothetical protein
MSALSPAAARQGKESADRGKVVPLCPLKSDSPFNGPGLLQNQLKGKVDAEVVGRNSDASRAPPGQPVIETVCLWLTDCE